MSAPAGDSGTAACRPTRAARRGAAAERSVPAGRGCGAARSRTRRVQRPRRSPLVAGRRRRGQAPRSSVELDLVGVELGEHRDLVLGGAEDQHPGADA